MLHTPLHRGFRGCTAVRHIRSLGVEVNRYIHIMSVPTLGVMGDNNYQFELIHSLSEISMYSYREKYIIVSSTKGRNKKMSNTKISFINHIKSQSLNYYFNGQLCHQPLNSDTSSQYHLFNKDTLTLTTIYFSPTDNKFHGQNLSSIHYHKFEATNTPHIFILKLIVNNTDITITINTLKHSIHFKIHY